MIACPCDHPAGGPYTCEIGSPCNPVPEHTCGEDVPAEVGVCGACKKGLRLCEDCRTRPADDQDTRIKVYWDSLLLDFLCEACFALEAEENR